MVPAPLAQFWSRRVCFECDAAPAVTLRRDRVTGLSMRRPRLVCCGGAGGESLRAAPQDVDVIDIRRGGGSSAGGGNPSTDLPEGSGKSRQGLAVDLKSQVD
jgi:hypothetical protein